MPSSTKTNPSEAPPAARTRARLQAAAQWLSTSRAVTEFLQDQLKDISSDEDGEDERKPTTSPQNVPPTSAQAANNTADQPGRPYYESLRSNLRQTLEKKRKLDEQLAALEDQIFKAEGTYLEETTNSGNIVRGFDGWVKGVQIGGRGGADDRRRARVRDEDRVFSRSSVSWMRAQEGPDSAPTSHAATPTASFAPQISARDSGAGGSNAMKSQNKKKRPTDRDDEDDGKSLKRGKITYARD